MNRVEFSVVPTGASGSWRVQIRVGADHIQYIYGFDSLFDATEWIEREDEWMKALGESSNQNKPPERRRGAN